MIVETTLGQSAAKKVRPNILRSLSTRSEHFVFGTGSEGGFHYSIYDLEARVWLVEKCDWDTEGRLSILHFWGPYIVASKSDASFSTNVYRVDFKVQALVVVAKPAEFSRSVQVPDCPLEYHPFSNYSGDSMWFTAQKKTFFSRVKFTDMEGRSNEELNQMIVDNHFKVKVDTLVKHFDCGGICVGGDSKSAVLTDLTTKQNISCLATRDTLSFVQWVDATTIKAECGANEFLIDFACRSINSGKPDPHAKPLLPTRTCRYAVITSDPTSKKKSVTMCVLRAQKLNATLSAIFKQQSVKLHTITSEPPKDIGIDAIHPSTYVWMPAKPGEGGIPSSFTEVNGLDATKHDDNVVSTIFAVPIDEWTSLQEAVTAPRPTHSRSRYTASSSSASSKAEEEAFSDAVWSQIEGQVEAVVLIASPASGWMFFALDEAAALKAFETANAK
jgi:hypothetical protein